MKQNLITFKGLIKDFLECESPTLREEIDCGIQFCALDPQIQRNLRDLFSRFDPYRKPLPDLFLR